MRARVGSDRGAVTPFLVFRFPDPPAEPDVPVSEHPALHVLLPLVGRLLSTLTGVSRFEAAPSFAMLLRQHGGGVFSPPLDPTAPRGARSRRSRPWTGPSPYCR